MKRLAAFSFAALYCTLEAQTLQTPTLDQAVEEAVASNLDLAAARYGIRVDVQADGTTMTALVDGLIHHFRPFLE